jgi:outer membrane immunogenic protein
MTGIMAAAPNFRCAFATAPHKLRRMGISQLKARNTGVTFVLRSLNLDGDEIMLRRILLASAGAIALSGAAVAADLTRPPPPPAYLPPPPLWTGFYLGINAGGTWSNSNAVNTTAFPGPCDITRTGCLANFGATSAALATFSVSRNNGAFIGGGQAGYNYQFGMSWVAGIEADIQGLARSAGNSTFTSSLVNPVLGESIAETATVSRQVDWLGTLRGRLGFLASPTFLIYGTGGLAYGGVTANTNITQVVVNDPTLAPYSSFGSLNNTRVGWTAGGGVEWIFLPNWSVKAEYLYYDLGSVSYTLSPLVNLSLISGTAVSTAFPRSSTRFNGNIVRAGLNYQFTWAPPPVVSKY